MTTEPTPMTSGASAAPMPGHDAPTDGPIQGGPTDGPTPAPSAETPAVPARAAAVEIRQFTKRYGDFKAVDGLDLDIPVGSVFGLIGPNGAGKTTTMSAIVTLSKPDAGTVRVFGHDPVEDTTKVRSLVGFMPDFFGLYDGLTCAEYLDFFGAAYGLDSLTRASQVDALLELVELNHKRDVDVQGLSRGMQQRLSLARALVHEPKLLVLDEPASGLDPRARVELREIIKELARQDITILLSSHILSEMQDLCDRIGVIEAGKMLAQGTPRDINTSMRYAHAVTVGVLGEVEAREGARAAMTAAGATNVVILGDGKLRGELPGSPEAAADLLADLIRAGVRVNDFTEEESGLEGLFLRITEGIVR